MNSDRKNPFDDLVPLTEIVCPKCHHTNVANAESCHQCNRHLLVFCGHCGHPNYRGDSRCVDCRTQLHFPGIHRWKSAKARKWIKPVEAALLVAAVLLTAKGVVELAEFDLPKREPAPPQVVVLKPDGTWQLK